MVRKGEWDKIGAEVSDDVVHLFAAVGTHDKIASAIKKRFGGVSDMVSAIEAPDAEPGLTSDLIQDLQGIETPFKNFKTDY